jgi:hypothetical protein
MAIMFTLSVPPPTGGRAPASRSRRPQLGLQVE